MISRLPGALGIAALCLSFCIVPPAGSVAAQTAPGSSPGSGAPSSAGGTGVPAAEGTIPTLTAYRIRQGDEVILTIYGEPTLTPATPLRVLQGGAISVPLVGSVAIAGLTTSGAGSAIKVALKKYLRDPRVTVAVYSISPIEALVLGNVRTPGKYALASPARLTDVLAAAGGLGPVDGDFPDARIVRRDGTTASVSLQKLLHDGDVTLDDDIESGDSVYIPAPTTFGVQVLGAVDKPGDVLIRQGDGVAMAIARAGTSTAQNPDLNHVAVTRRLPDGTTSTQTINIYDIVQHGNVAHDLVLQKNDLVFVPQARKGGGSAVGDALITIRRLVFPF